MPLAVSIVINTYNRAGTIANTLDSLPYLDYPRFEVIVVNGPSTDNTEDVLRSYGPKIKHGRCAEANLSVSRNIGIGMADGDVVAFIDDDAVPEPEWLTRIAAAYDSEDVGGAGGFVYDHTGYEFQSRYILCDRVGNAVFGCETNPTEVYNFPFAHQYCSLMGTNATYRRSALLSMGGFDEYFAYYLDETDVCLRLVDHGYKIVFLEDAYVHHKFAASHIRDTRRVLKDRTQIARSKGYFTIRNSEQTLTFCEAYESLREWLEMVRNGICWELEHGFINAAEKKEFFAQLDRGLQEGMEEALSQPRRLLCASRAENLHSPFLPYQRLEPAGSRLTIVYLSQDYPPARYGGIGKWTHEMAAAAASRGHYVHVITKGEGHNRVDFEEGVWVHRMVPRSAAPSSAPWDLPRTVLDYSYMLHEEVRRIAGHHKVDLVISPIWDHEGIACLADPELTTVITLQTTFQLMLESHPEWNCDANHRVNYIDKMIHAEYEVLRRAPFILSNSAAMPGTIKEAYGIEIEPERLGLSLLGIKDTAHLFEPHVDGRFVTVLFVGRLEKRKGVDLLLRCIPGICREHDCARFILVGEDNHRHEGGRTFREEFEGEHKDLIEQGRVLFTGRVSDDELQQHYADCDIFVSPSVFESFGLIFTEAMMFGKPVIGCRAGGMVEVIADGENGILAVPGDWLSLYEALLRLLKDGELRERFGRRSREIFEEKFTCDKMADRTLEYYREVVARAVRENTSGEGRAAA